LAKGKLNFAWDGKLRVARHTSGKKLMKPKSGKERNAHHFIVLFFFFKEGPVVGILLLLQKKVLLG
jgi:hypothetical protein